MSNYFKIRRNDIHDRGTRHCGDLVLDKVKLECTKRAFFYKGAKIMYDPLFTRKFFTDASLINVQLVSMRGVGIIKRTIYKNISNYKTIYKRIGVTLLVHKGNLNIYL